MSLDRSLKISGGLIRHRNVLTRAEKVQRLKERGKFDMDKSSPLHLPKVGHRKVVAKKK
ncbi:MAG: small basic protein [Phycisphaeraceae bacterium]